MHVPRTADLRRAGVEGPPPRAAPKGLRPRASAGASCASNAFGAALLAALLAAPSAAPAASVAVEDLPDQKGPSWVDPPLRDTFASADLVAECRVVLGGQWRAEVEIIRVFRVSDEFASAGEPAPAAGELIEVEGFNSFEWNTAYHALRADERVILALCRVPPRPASSAGKGVAGPSGAGKGRRGTFTLGTPSSGRFPVGRDRVVGRFGEADFMVEVPADDFRALVSAYCRSDVAGAARELGRFLDSKALETRYLAVVFLGELPPGAGDSAASLLAPLSGEANPALREAAAHALGRIGGDEASRALAAFLEGRDRTVARAAALAVCESGACRGAMGPLIAWLSRSTAEDLTKLPSAVRKDVFDAQSRVFNFLAEGRWQRHVEADERAAAARAVVGMIASGRTAVAIAAVRVLAAIRAPEAVPGLIRLLGAEDRALREEASRALVITTLTPAAARKDEIPKWWARHRDEPRREWVARGLALAERLLAAESYDGDAVARVLLTASRDPLAPWHARRKLAGGRGWDELELDGMHGPLVAAFAELGLTGGLSSERTSALRALRRILEDFPEAGCSFADEFLRASFDVNTLPRKEALAALGDLDHDRASARCRAALIERLVDELDYSLDEEFQEVAAESLRKLAGRRLGYYVSKGYDLEEETRGLERWRAWRREISLSPGAFASGRGGHAPGPRPSVTVADVARLLDPDPDVWLDAATRFVAGDEAARKGLEVLSRHESARVRAIATALLGLRAERGSAPALEARLADDEAFVRVQAAWALGRALRGTGSPPEKLLAAGREAIPKREPDDAPFAGDSPLSSDPWSTYRPPTPGPTVFQVTAIHALGKIGGAEAVRVLRAACLSDESRLATEAAWALDACPPRPSGRAKPLQEPDSRRGTADAARADEALAEEAILEAVAAAGSAAREFAARAVARRRPAGSAAAIARAYSREGIGGTYGLWEALVRAARPEDVPVLAAMIDAVDDSGSYAACRALGRLLREGEEAELRNSIPGGAASRALAASLLRGVQGGLSYVRYYAARALRELGRRGLLDEGLRPEIAAALAERLTDMDKAIASSAASALEHAGHPSAARALMVYLRSWEPPDPRAMGAVVRIGGRGGLAFALRQIDEGQWGAKYFSLSALPYAAGPGGSGRDPATMRAMVGVLVKAWSDPESHFHEAAERSLRAFGARAVPALAALLGAGPLASGSAGARPKAGPRAAEADVGVRRRAAELLGDIAAATGDARARAQALAALAGAVASEDAALAFIADRALARVKGEMPSSAQASDGALRHSEGRAPSLGLHSTEEERRAASVRWRNLFGP